MRNPFFVSRLAAFTISLLLLTESVESGWGIQPDWPWYLALVLLTLMTSWDFVSLVACVLSFLVLVGAIDEGRAVHIALTIFTGVALLRPPRWGLTWSTWSWSSWSDAPGWNRERLGRGRRPDTFPH